MTSGNAFTEGIVSIVIPCYKGERYLAQAIESCLGQTYHAVEVIVVDDASPDGCAKIATEYSQRDARVRVVRRKRNGGVSRAFNSGFELARGQYLSRLAQDDVFRKDTIERMVGYLEKHPDVGLVYCDMERIDETGKTLGVQETAEPEESLRQGDKIGLCVMWTRATWEKTGGFDPVFGTAEDYEYWLRLSRCCSLGKCAGEPALYVRFHPMMGSNVFAQRQAVASHLALRLHSPRLSENGEASEKHSDAGHTPAALAALYRDAAWQFQVVGDFRAALPCAWRAFCLQPWHYSYWKHLAGAWIRWGQQAVRTVELGLGHGRKKLK